MESRAAKPSDHAATPEWLHAATRELEWLRDAAVPSWLRVEELPSIIAGARRLNEEEVWAVLTALWQSRLDAPEPLIPALKAHADRASLDAFAWRLFECWTAQGAPAREKWALTAVGLLGSDDSALKLAPLIRAWPGQNRYRRAVAGLACLRAIGTETALMEVACVARESRSSRLQAEALALLEQMAGERGLTRVQLEDRLAPDCGLDSSGSRSFEFGRRNFRVILGPGMRPLLRDEHGRLRRSLPGPTGGDPSRTAAAAEWRLLKKQLAVALRTQAARLEEAMISGRRWPAGEWKALLVEPFDRNPLMTHLGRAFVWGALDASGRLAASFRVTEDLSFSGPSDQPLALEPYPEVVLVHPLHLSQTERDAWTELLCDYEIVPPFPQIGRTIHTLEPEETSRTEITRFGGVRVPVPLERLGWRRRFSPERAMVCSHCRFFPGANVTAVLQYEEGLGSAPIWTDQTIARCCFISGELEGNGPADLPEQLPLLQVDPVVISEVLRDLTGACSR
jgi:uncharacterized protein DUF4132